MPRQYILRGQTPVPEPDLLKWGEWLQNADQRVADTTVNGKLVSTIFLGLDHSFGNGEPLLFETMIFPEGGGGAEEYCDRYATWTEAEQGHKKAVEIAKGLS